MIMGLWNAIMGPWNVNGDRVMRLLDLGMLIGDRGI